ncbi:MAG: energy-coupling factor ABC transporter permease [Sterolibacterium sp.]
MHMADALLSPTVGVAFWAASGATLAWCSRRIQKDTRDYLVPLMGVLGAFVFAAQMINFTLPGTGSSGHIGGGLLLSILLGSPAAFIVIASVLTVQALFFADGGLLALGANLFNLGIFPCFIAFPLIYRPLLARAGDHPSPRRMGAITLLATVVAMQFGALGVVIETQLSGISSLPLGAFLWLMQSIHLAIGLVEGIATAALVLFIRQARPDDAVSAAPVRFPIRLIAGWGLAAVITGGVVSWFASSQPDGLEWSIAHATGKAEVSEPESALHARIAALQKHSAVLPDYKLGNAGNAPSAAAKDVPTPQESKHAVWPAVDGRTSLSGVVGGVATLILIMAIGYLSYLFRRRRQDSGATAGPVVP